MTEFDEKSCVVVRGLVDETTIGILSLYMENKLKRGQWDSRPEQHTKNNQPSQYHSYADPMAEVVLQQLTDKIEDATGKKLHPTYSFSRIYVKGDELTPHTDRPSCEISATINIATVGKHWPIWMKAPNEAPFKVELNPGDAVIYKGCEVVHWRDKMVDSEVNVQFMLHYVDQNGPNAGYKWDQRQSLGYDKQ